MTQADALKTAQAEMYSGRFDAAVERLDSVLAGQPDHVEALYMTAVCRRYLRQADAARATLLRLRRAAPEFGRGFQEEGHLHRMTGDTERALVAYQRACRFNPALEASWRAQADILEARGQGEAARQARGHAAALEGLPPHLLSAANHLYEGRPVKAEKLCRHFLRKNPRHVEAMRLLAEIGARMNALDEAEFLLESALEFEPDHVGVRLDYGKVLRKRQKFAAALDQARILYDRDPDNPVFRSNLAVATQIAGDIDRALELFDEVLATLPEDLATLMSRGHALKTVGRQEEAIDSYRGAFRSKPDHGDAYWSLANLKTYRFTDDEMAAMHALERSDDIAPTDLLHVCFALGKAYEDREAYETSFRLYDRGNALKREQTRYRADYMEEELVAQAAVCTQELFARQGGKGHPAPDPIFIVGLPRAGSTLLEQILASHSMVDGTMELPDILALSHKLRGRRRVTTDSPYPSVLFDLPGEKLAEMGRAYIEATRIHRRGAPFFIDKMPNNFRHLGLLHLILPRARIIDARRNALDCCLSGFKQLFAEGQEFTYSLADIGRYYRSYVELMAHWDRVMPGQVLRVDHEALIEDFEPQVRRLLDFCGLPFEKACLDFHKTARAVRTASSEQVRRPINRAGIGQWRHFEPWLDPLVEALGPDLVDRARTVTARLTEA